ncbi:MAG: hypothetical protein H6926_08260 [Chromatiales bacterium]|nr:hypothetical protein [Chromatiales bacterium]
MLAAFSLSACDRGAEDKPGAEPASRNSAALAVSPLVAVPRPPVTDSTKPPPNPGAAPRAMTPPAGAIPGTAAGPFPGAPGGSLPGTLFDRTRHPAVRSAADNPAYAQSNLRMMPPEMLNRVLHNSFCTDSSDSASCIELDHNGDNPLAYPNAQNMTDPVAYEADPYQIMLGGVDYTYVKDRVRDPGGVTPLVMFNLIDSYCDQLVDAGDIFPNQGDAESTIRYMYRKVRSRPISDAALDGAKSLVSGLTVVRPMARATAPGSGAGPEIGSAEVFKIDVGTAEKKNLCRYFFLIDGGFILY